MKHCKTNQGRAVIAVLKRRALTYSEMLDLKQGNSPWKRVSENLGPDEELHKAYNRQGLITWRVRPKFSEFRA